MVVIFPNQCEVNFAIVVVRLYLYLLLISVSNSNRSAQGNEMNNYCRKHTNFSIIVSKRFYPLYGITLFELLSIDSKNRIVHIYNTIIKYIDKVLIKLKLYTFLNFLLTPFENMFGGVLIIIAQRK